MRKHFWRIALVLTLLGVFAGHAAGWLVLPWLPQLESELYNARVRAVAPGTVDDRIVVVPSLGTKGAIRAVITAAGIHDILSKVYGSSNPVNATRAAIEALSQLRTAAQISAARGKRVRIRVGGQQETKEAHNG